jgi:hypothetical protein
VRRAQVRRVDAHARPLVRREGDVFAVDAALERVRQTLTSLAAELRGGAHETNGRRPVCAECRRRLVADAQPREASPLRACKCRFQRAIKLCGRVRDGGRGRERHKRVQRVVPESVLVVAILTVVVVEIAARVANIGGPGTGILFELHAQRAARSTYHQPSAVRLHRLLDLGQAAGLKHCASGTILSRGSGTTFEALVTYRQGRGRKP